jgi:hypothetical protein
LTKLITPFKYKNVLRLGSKAAQWKGGRLKRGKYWFIYKPDHPFASKDGYVAEHRLVYEAYYNCILLNYVQIHHIDGNSINNSIQNLVPCYNGQHRKKYHKLDTSNRLCLFCKSNKTYFDKSRKYFVWRKYKDGFICNICYCNYIRIK